MDVAQSKRTIRNSIERIDQHLIGKGYMVITTLANELNLSPSSVKKCLDTLEKLDRIALASNGKIILVKSKVDENGTGD